MNSKMLDETYIPGKCNIGSGEVKRRKIVGLLALFFSASSLLSLILVDAPREARLGIFFPLIIASIGYFQSRNKFCLAYGLAGTFNLGKLGDISRVGNSVDRAADRAYAYKILGKSFLLAVIATAGVFVLPF